MRSIAAHIDLRKDIEYLYFEETQCVRYLVLCSVHAMSKSESTNLVASESRESCRVGTAMQLPNALTLLSSLGRGVDSTRVSSCTRTNFSVSSLTFSH